MYAAHNWDEALRIQAQQRAAAKARAQAEAELQTRVRAMNETAARQQAKPWEAHARQFEAFRKRQQEEADAEARARAEANWREFNERLHQHQSELTPFFELLGIVSRRPTKAEVRTAYIRKIRTVHPDLGGSAEEAKRVNAAYQFLMKKLDQ